MFDKSIISSAPALPLRSSAWVGPRLLSNARLKLKRGAVSRRLQVHAGWMASPQHDNKKTYWQKSSTQAVELLLSDQPLDEDDRAAIAETLKLLNWISSAGQRSSPAYPPSISDGATTSPSNAVAGGKPVFFDADATDPGKVDNNLERKLEVSPGYSNTLLLQGFNWDSCRHTGGWYNHVLKHTAEIAGAGSTHIYLPPPSQSVSAEGYLPNQLYQLNSKYGTKEELKKLISALHKVGVKAVADIVINHRCADKQNKNGEWVIYTDEVEHKGHSLSWGEWAIVSDDPIFHGSGNSSQGGEIYHAAPDLDHSNKDVRLALVDWINYLKTDIGFSGWRFDFAKGYPPVYTEEYVRSSVGKESFCVGEIWTSCGYGPSGLNDQQDKHRQGLVDWVDATKGSAAAFDFTTKAILQEAVKDQLWRLRDASGRPAGMLGWWPNRAVTFLDNHDTGGTQNHWPFPMEHIGQGYAYILTHPGIPCVFWDHLFKYGKDITPLIKARKTAQVKAESRVVIRAAESDFYLAEITGDAGSLLVKLGSRLNMGSLAPGKAYKLYTSGKNYAVWMALRSDSASQN